MTSLDKILHDQQMADMASFDEEMPSVGIFWYDTVEHNFFGVHKEQLTPKMVEEASDRGLPFVNYKTLHRQLNVYNQSIPNL